MLVNSITDGFFETLRIPVIVGRSFRRGDGNAEPVAIVNQVMADFFGNGETAVGNRFKFGAADAPGAWITVVGVVGEIHQLGLGEKAGPALYVPHTQAPFVFGNVVVRTTGELSTMIGAMRRTLWSVDPNMPIERIGPLAEQMEETISEPRFYAWLLGSFAFVALILAAIGIYGTISYSVRQRTHEIGIRMALGASRRDVLRLIVSQAARIVAIGLGIGIVGAMALSRFLRGLVFDIGTVDGPTFATVSAVLALVAAVSMWLPTIRATRVQPMETLRSE